MATKYIFVTGGVVSSLGKGVSSASIGALLQSRGYTVHIRKFDPYLNTDPGDMSPLQHGEVFITDDGFATDLDLGYYERFLGIQLSRNDSNSGGKVFSEVLSASAAGAYGGGTVQMIPHVTNKIREHIANPTGTDFLICEIGGTVGDIEGLIFLEAARQFANYVGRKNAMFVHLTLAPYIAAADELKTKPTQQSVRMLLEKGIQADALIVRTPRVLTRDEREKISLFCNISPDNVISGIDMKSIYEIPLSYDAQGLTARILEHFGLTNNSGTLARFQKIADYTHAKNAGKLPTIKIALVGKYIDNADAYKSLSDAIFAAGGQNNVSVQIVNVPLGTVVPDDINGIIMPNATGADGFSDAAAVAAFARKNKIPFLGIGFGMAAAFDTTFNETYSGRVGGFDTIITDTRVRDIYGADKIRERHHHRYELPVANVHDGIVAGGSADKKFVDIAIDPTQNFFIGTSFQPEFTSSPFTAHPLISAFISATK